MPPLRIGLTISGAIALGAYEGGAVAALLCGIQGINEHERKHGREPDAVAVDVIAGASAGSITALLATRTLVEGMDPVKVMYGAWVELPDLKRLLGHKRGEPMATTAARQRAPTLLALPPHPARAQAAPVSVNMALASLRELSYRIGRIDAPPVDATTHLDWGEWTFHHGQPLEDYTGPPNSAPLDVALASGAHLAAFPPYGLDRSPAKPGYVHNKLRNFPPSGWIWYTDGGTIDNQPLGRALDLSGQIDSATDGPSGGGERLHLLITPDPGAAVVGDDKWSRRAPRPSFTDAGARALTLLRQQHLYEDLRHAEKTNSRIRWTEQLVGTLAKIIDGREPDPAAALERVIADIEAEKPRLFTDEVLPASQDRRPSEWTGPLERALRAATGLGDKRKVAVEVISPDLLNAPGDELTPDQRLAGDLLHAFGGFAWQPLRENDFAVGYDSMLRWMEHGLARHGVPDGRDGGDSLVAVAVESASSRRGQWRSDLGRDSFADLPVRGKLRLARYGWRLATTLLGDQLGRLR